MKDINIEVEVVPEAPRLPTNIDVLGKTYTIEYHPMWELFDNLGTATRSKSTIKLATDQTRANLQDTVLHEIIHIINSELQLDLGEATVGRLACGLHSAGVRVKGFD